MKSRALIVAYFSRTEFRSDLAVDVRPRNPFPIRQADREDVRVLARMTRSVDELSRVVSDIEPDGKGLPVLLRQYLKLGARFLAFGIDPRFGHCVDGLIELDVPGADPRTLQRYMGREAARSYLAVHAGHRQAADARADSGLDVSDEAELYHDPQPTPEHAVA
jgi:hypothetical protein